MKALSLKQPWAEHVVSGRKTIEVRKWNTSFRGKFYVHASGTEKSEFPTRAIVGTAVLVEVKKYTGLDEFLRDRDKHLAGPEWFKNPCYGFVLKDAERIKPTACKGALNFFEPTF